MRNNRDFRILSKQVKYENPWLRVIELETLTDGKKGIYGVVERSDSATIIIESHDNKILFVRQYRFPIQDYSWELPMGGLDNNEFPSAGAVRELEEETGITVELKRIGEFKPVPGLTPQTATVFYGNIGIEEAQKVNEFDQNVDEITDRKFLSKEEIYDMILSNKISDGFTLSSLAMFLFWKSNI